MRGAINLACFVERARTIIDLIGDAEARGYDPDATLTSERFSELKSLVTAHESDLGASAETDAAFQALAKRSRELYARFYCHAEASACLRTITRLSATDPVAFTSNNDALALAEAAAAQLTPGSTLAFVGCGSFPWSVVRYHRLAGCSVTGVDFNSLAIHLAQEAIETLRLRSVIKFIEADAREVDYAAYSHVVVAAMALPKAEICQRVAETASPGSRLVIRSARGLNRLFYEGYEPGRAAPVHGYLPRTAGSGELESWITSVGSQSSHARQRVA